MSSAIKRRSFYELQAPKLWPGYEACRLDASPPPRDVCFLTVADFRFYRGLEALVLSLCEVYKDIANDIYILHDGSLSRFLKKRLLSLYPKCIFLAPRPAWVDHIVHDSSNRRRIGYLGYLNTVALSLSGYRRVIVLDSDALILGSLHPLWDSGDAFRLVPDCGARPWAPISSVTGRPVLNSGVISVPGWALCPDEQRLLDELIVKSAEPSCPLLDRFADQKIWNQYLADRDVDIMPVNYNCNVKYWHSSLGGVSFALSILHFAGPKPWLTWPWLDPGDAPTVSSPHLNCSWFAAATQFWNQHYCRLLADWRLASFRQSLDADPGLPASGDACIVGSFEAIADLDSGFDSLHLIVVDLAAFGGIFAEAIVWPAEWLAMAGSVGVIHLWLPFELSSFFVDHDIPHCFMLHWVLIEAPFSPELAQDVDAPVASSQALCFEPWSLDPVRAMAAAVQRRLRHAGCQPVLRCPGLS